MQSCLGWCINAYGTQEENDPPQIVQSIGLPKGVNSKYDKKRNFIVLRPRLSKVDSIKAIISGYLYSIGTNPTELEINQIVEHDYLICKSHLQEK